MKNKIFFLLIIAVTAFTWNPLHDSAFAEENYVEGIAYKKITPEQPTTTGSKIEVVELFWYGCPHCHRFQPYIERWASKIPENVAHVRMPAILRESWTIHARAYYTAEALGVIDKIHSKFFDAMHKQKRMLNTEEALMDFFAENGVKNEEFKKVFNSFAVDGKVRRARQMTYRYRTPGTPAVVVNGKYLTGPVMAGSFANLIKIVDFLVAKETTIASK